MSNHTTTIKCPSCGSPKAESTYEPIYQEYAGASPQGGYTSIECSECGYTGSEKESEAFEEYSVRENRRGW